MEVKADRPKAVPFCFAPFHRRCCPSGSNAIPSTVASSLSERSAPYLRRESEDTPGKCPVGAAAMSLVASRSTVRRHDAFPISPTTFFFSISSLPPSCSLSLSCARDASKFRTTQVANARPMVTSVSFVRDKRETERGRKHGEDRPRESKEEQALRGKKAAFDSRPKPLSLSPLFRCCGCCSPPACPASSSPLRCVSAPSAHAPAHPPLPRKTINERNPPSPATARLARRRARRRDWPLGRYQRRRLRAPRGQPGDQARDLAALPQRAPLGG